MFRICRLERPESASRRRKAESQLPPQLPSFSLRGLTLNSSRSLCRQAKCFILRSAFAFALRNRRRKMRMACVFVIMCMLVPVAGIDPDQVKQQ